MPIIQRSAIRAVSRASRTAGRMARQNTAGLSTASRLALPAIRSANVPSFAKASRVQCMYRSRPPY